MAYGHSEVGHPMGLSVLVRWSLWPFRHSVAQACLPLGLHKICLISFHYNLVWAGKSALQNSYFSLTS